MEICVIGFGNVGGRLSSLWKQAGHTLRIGLRPGSDRAAAAASEGAQVLSPAHAAAGAQVVVLALPWIAVEATLGSMQLSPGTILVDATNPLSSSLKVLVPSAGSGARQVAQWAAGTRVVKAFNTIGAPYYGDARFDLFYCGDDAEANAVVSGLIADIAMRAVDVGPLRNAAYLEQLAGLWIDLAMRGVVQGAFGFNLVKGEGA